MDKDKFSKCSLSTRAIHVGSEPDPQTGAVIVPIYQTSTYALEAPGKDKGFVYSRTGNPTRTAYEKVFADLESARFGLAFSSGMSAVDTIMKTMRPGDHIIAGDDLYGGVYRLFTTVYQQMGFDIEFVDLFGDFDIEPLIKDNTKMVWLETPTNPLLKVADIGRIAKIANARKIPLLVDNTFMSPVLQLPLNLGADIVLHSSTKYIGGHSDLVGGAIAVNDEGLYEKYKTMQNSAGAVPGPFDCFLAHRGIKTLSVRMKTHCENAVKITEWLNNHSRVNKVIYPMLDNHPHYEIAKKQQLGGGGMISFEVKGGEAKALEIISNTEIFLLAESLGGVESLINHPATMTHASVPAEVRTKIGLTDSLIRLSVGIEHVDDLLGDLDRALG